MHLYIRADADTKIGTGHIMRCIALGQAWQDHGGKVTFISHCETVALRQRIINEGFDFISVENSYSDSNDLSQTLAYLKHLSPTWLVLDGYYFTPDYQKSIRDAGIRLLVIDDMSHLSHYHADIILNQNIHGLDLNYCCDEDTTLLLGTRYVLLRREFLKYRDFKRQVPERAKNILVTLGGGDPDNVTLKVIEAIKLLNGPDLEVKIVIGPSNPHVAEIKNSLLSTLCHMHCIENAGNMPELMIWADLAISGGGSTCWELSFMGLPNIVLILAENQRRIAEGLNDAGVAVNLGWCNKVTDDNIAEAIEGMIKDKEIQRKMSLLGQELVDGYGSGKICEIIKEETV
jgi:UDP-2,4-diacetamido-2,4,6-trideoxy-beta-L-altropyranose hydrolase